MVTTTRFNQSSYLSQLRQLRRLAYSAVAKFPIKVKSVDFIHHGENTTFRVLDVNGQIYLLRIHRNDYHSRPALAAELKWIAYLSKLGFSVPNPVRSKNKNLIEMAESANIGSRNCSLLEWIHGEFVGASVKPEHMFKIGRLLAEFQNHAPKRLSKNRRYWTAVGLVGPNPKFGSIDHLHSVTRREQKMITRARKSVLKKLKRFENKYPDRQGLIHADLHFGNLVFKGGVPGAIDFDDCGFGFFAYDLVIPYLSVQRLLDKKKMALLPEYKKALIAGYQAVRKWDKEDDAIFRYLVVARKLLMLGWLNSRSDNPRLKKFFKGAVKEVLVHIRAMN